MMLVKLSKLEMAWDPDSPHRIIFLSERAANKRKLSIERGSVCFGREIRPEVDLFRMQLL